MKKNANSLLVQAKKFGNRQDKAENIQIKRKKIYSAAAEAKDGDNVDAKRPKLTKTNNGIASERIARQKRQGLK